jgi:hypothetical protein
MKSGVFVVRAAEILFSMEFATPRYAAALSPVDAGFLKGSAHRKVNSA